jgi:hypothetical protein
MAAETMPGGRWRAKRNDGGGAGHGDLPYDILFPDSLMLWPLMGVFGRNRLFNKVWSA